MAVSQGEQHLLCPPDSASFLKPPGNRSLQDGNDDRLLMTHGIRAGLDAELLEEKKG